jgi:hypothetical protein
MSTRHKRVLTPFIACSVPSVPVRPPTYNIADDSPNGKGSQPAEGASGICMSGSIKAMRSPVAARRGLSRLDLPPNRRHSEHAGAGHAGSSVVRPAPAKDKWLFRIVRRRKKDE